MILDEVAHDRLGALLAELSVRVLIARLVCVARHFDEIALCVFGVLCNLVGRDIEAGELPNDDSLVGPLVRNICHENARQYFQIER